MEYKVLITTSGIGQRLGELTKYTNKALVSIHTKPTLSYIIDLYPQDTHFVILLGYYGEQVKDFLEITYPKRKFTFVRVDKFVGEGTSLGYSMLQAKSELQCPFIFHACDTLVREKVPAPSINWIGGFKGEGSSNYASFDTLNSHIEQIYEKGFIGADYLHIGLVGVKDYKQFWKTLEHLYRKDKKNSSLSDVHVIGDMLTKKIMFKSVQFHEWYDTGSVEGLQKAREKMNTKFHNLDKLEESIFVFDKFIVKFFFNDKLVTERVERAKKLKGLVPQIEDVKRNFYRYEYVKGDLYSEIATPSNFIDFLVWAKKNLWKRTSKVSDKKFKEICYDFYYDKSLFRINKFLDSHGFKDTEDIINGEKVPSIKKMFSMIDFDWLCGAEQTTFHGDFILDNIIKTKKGFCLLDWRQNFGGLLESGDKYYDLAKLNHNLTVNHGIVTSNLLTVEIKDGQIFCDIFRKENLVQCQQAYHKFLLEEGYDIKKVKLLTALIWLNMSPLHHHPFDHFLYYFGKLNLWRVLNEK